MHGDQPGDVRLRAAAFGALRELTPATAGNQGLLLFFTTAAAIQLVAAAAYLSGRRSS